MSEQEKKESIALEIYLSSATLENDFTPISYGKIRNEMISQGYETSTSAIGRWAKKNNWAVALENKINTAYAVNTQSLQEVSALAQTQAVKQTAVDVARNSELISSSYEVLELYVKQVKDDFEKKGRLNQDDVKIVKDIATLTSTREDKMLDRIANTPDKKIDSDQILEELSFVDIEIDE
jgi:hypothetical protein